MSWDVRRVPLALAAAVLSVGLAGCYGATDDAGSIEANRARLKAHGTANNGPAYSYFEYWKAATPNDKQRTATRNWPANASGPFSDDVAALASGTEYVFRMCGGDAGRAAVCVNDRRFHTPFGNSVVYRRGDAIEFLAAPGTRQETYVFTQVSFYQIVDSLNVGESRGTAVLPFGPPCTRGTFQYGVVSTECPREAVTRFRLFLGDGDDKVGQQTYRPPSVPMTIDGGPGDDIIVGGVGSNFLVGGPGRDTFTGGTDDIINAQDGEADTGFCFGGKDTVYVDPGGLDDFSNAGCEVVTTAPAPPTP